MYHLFLCNRHQLSHMLVYLVSKYYKNIFTAFDPHLGHFNYHYQSHPLLALYGNSLSLRETIYL